MWAISIVTLTRGRFYAELTILTNAHSYLASDVDRLPLDSYTFTSANTSEGTSWIDHMVKSTSNLSTIHKVIQGFTFCDSMPLYFEAVMNIQIVSH